VVEQLVEQHDAGAAANEHEILKLIHCVRFSSL
jgi:hypothetical protein